MTKIHLTLASLLALGVLAFAVSSTPALAAARHEYLFQITESQPGQGFGRAESMTVDSGHLWVAENGGVDELDASAGAFIARPIAAGVRPGGGIAVGHGPGIEHALYVSTGSAVGVFSETGVPKGSWTGEGPGGPGSLAGEEGLAVDNSTETFDEGKGDVYVAVPAQKVVDVFHPETDGEEHYVGRITGTSPSEPFLQPLHVAVDDANGDVLVLDYGFEKSVVDVFEPTVLHGYTFVRKIPSPGRIESAYNLAVDGGNGEVYATEGYGATTIDQFNSTGRSLGHITGSDSPQHEIYDTFSLTVDPESHRVYIGDSGKGIDVYGPDIVVPQTTTDPASKQTPSSATLNGMVNPENVPVTSCEFEYGTSASYGETVSCKQTEAEIGSGSGEVPVSAEIKGLSPGTTYHFRLRAANKNSRATEPDTGDDETFATPGPAIEETFAREVTDDSAAIDTVIDPDGNATSWHVEYDTREYRQGEAGHGTNVPEGSLGSGQAALPASETLHGLAPSTEYWYRIVAVSEVDVEGVTEAVTSDGPDQTFTTQGAGTEFALPDGRQYELVGPSQRQGALFMGAPFSESKIGENSCVGPCAIQAAAGGEAFTDEAQQPSEREPRGNSNRVSVLMVRGASGWSSRVIAGPHLLATGAALGLGGEYARFSEDLSHAALDQWGSFDPLSLDAVESTPYLRTDYFNGKPSERCEGADLSSSSCFAPLVTRADTQSGVVFGDAFDGECPAIDCGPQFLAGTPDLSHVLIGAREQLTAAPVVVGRGQANSLPEPALYEWYEGALRLVNILPGREVGGGPEVAWRQGDGRRELSNSGARALLEGVSNFLPDGGLYLRDLAREETLQLNLPEPGCAICASGGRYETANVEDTRIFMVAGNRLTRNASQGGTAEGRVTGDLYECAIVEENGKDRCALTDLTPETNGESSNVQSVLGTSQDGSYVYFAAGAKLAPGATPHDPCSCNLYVRHEGVTSFIAQLSPTDLGSYDSSTGRPKPYSQLFARVSPNGRWLAFMSDRGLGGYDTRDAVGGEPDEEVYLYDAGAKTLSCASCDPSGGRPVGVENGKEGIAASVPAWSEPGTTPNVYQPRYLSDSGRLFFDSKDALVPLDVNGVTDVYEYEPQGVPEGAAACSPASASASDVFKAARQFTVEGVQGEEGAGCVALISSGTSLEQSVFLDASETGGEGPHGEGLEEGGGDVFFLTGSKLTANDLESGLSVFDAQECTGSAPCPAPAPVAPPPCDTEASCRPAPTPQPSIYGLPSSATFAGPSAAVLQLGPSSAPAGKKTVRKTVKCRKVSAKHGKRRCAKAGAKEKQAKRSRRGKGRK